MPPRSPIPLPVVVRAVPIELCQFLKFGGLAGTGGEAKQVISQGLVQVNGAVETQKRKKLFAGDQVAYDGKTLVVALA
jgi:ribosome-associated protein